MIEDSLFNMDVLESLRKLKLNFNQKRFVEERKDVLRFINNYSECILYFQEKMCYQDIAEYFKNKQVFDLANVIIAGIIICRNEEDNIINCIKSIIDVFDEIVIIDTGSKDNTINLINSAKSNKIKLYNFEWSDSFADARNYAIKKTNCDCVFFIDADELLSQNISYERMHMIFNHFNQISFKNELVFTPIIINKYTDNKDYAVERIHYKNDKMCYFGDVHEELRYDNRQPEIIRLNIEIIHSGYINKEIVKKNKIQRNLKLLEKMFVKEPFNAKWKYMYVKDGFGYIDNCILIEMILRSVLKDAGEDISKENLRFNRYTYGFLNHLCKIYISNGNFDKIPNIVKLMDIIIPNSSDGRYYELMSAYFRCKEQISEILGSTIEYRKSHMDSQDYMSSTEGYHIDFIIALLLFDLNNYSSAVTYLEFLQDKFYDNNMNNLIDKYYKIADFARRVVK